MKITNIKVNQNEKNETIINLMFDGKYPFAINNNTGKTLFDNEYLGEIDWSFDKEEIEEMKLDPNSFFLNSIYFQNPDFGGVGLSLYLRNGSKKDYLNLALKYNCYLGQCWCGNKYDYIVFLQMDFE